MQEFTVRFRSLTDIQEFVALAGRQKVNLLVGSERFRVNATSFMGMFALNCKRPQKVMAECTMEELEHLRGIFGKFLEP